MWAAFSSEDDRRRTNEESALMWQNDFVLNDKTIFNLFVLGSRHDSYLNWLYMPLVYLLGVVRKKALIETMKTLLFCILCS